MKIWDSVYIWICSYTTKLSCQPKQQKSGTKKYFTFYQIDLCFTIGLVTSVPFYYSTISCLDIIYPMTKPRLVISEDKTKKIGYVYSFLYYKKKLYNDPTFSGSLDEWRSRGAFCFGNSNPVHVSNELCKISNGWPDLQISGQFNHSIVIRYVCIMSTL